MNSLHLPCWDFYLKKDSVQQITVWDLYPVLEEILDPKELMSSQSILLCHKKVSHQNEQSAPALLRFFI
jgi:hypothetical protein